jgi:uncharacterized membrane protein YhaH (DUF805 family)
MGPAKAIKTCIKKSLQFSGRASRPEFWWPYLSWAIISFVLFTIFDSLSYLEPKMWPFLLLLPSLMLAVPLVSCLIRRLHDTGGGTLLAIATLLFTGLSAVLVTKSGLFQETFFRLDVVGTQGEMFVSEKPTDLNTVKVNLLPMLTTLIASVLSIILLFKVLSPSKSGPNRFGPNPNEVPS